jgi:hypothetical protein
MTAAERFVLQAEDHSPAWLRPLEAVKVRAELDAIIRLTNAAPAEQQDPVPAHGQPGPYHGTSLKSRLSVRLAAHRVLGCDEKADPSATTGVITAQRNAV